MEKMESSCWEFLVIVLKIVSFRMRDVHWLMECRPFFGYLLIKAVFVQGSPFLVHDRLHKLAVVLDLLPFRGL